VVFPAPLGPRKPTISPGWIEKLMPSTAFTSSYLRLKKARTLLPKPPSRFATR